VQGSHADDLWVHKAEQSLLGAQSELEAQRYDNVANRCYYACFQAAIAALLAEGIKPLSGSQWGHDYVQAQFAGQLIGRRKLYVANMGGVLLHMLALRRVGDYTPDSVTPKAAERGVRQAHTFVTVLRQQKRRGFP